MSTDNPASPPVTADERLEAQASPPITTEAMIRAVATYTPEEAEAARLSTAPFEMSIDDREIKGTVIVTADHRVVCASGPVVCAIQLTPDGAEKVRAEFKRKGHASAVMTIASTEAPHFVAGTERATPVCTGDVPPGAEAVESRFVELFYLAHPSRIGLRFEGLPDIYVPDHDAHRLALAVSTGGESQGHDREAPGALLLEGVGWDTEILKGLKRDDTLLQFVVRTATERGYFAHRLQGERALLFGNTAATVLRALEDGARAQGILPASSGGFTPRTEVSEVGPAVFDAGGVEHTYTSPAAQMAGVFGQPLPMSPGMEHLEDRLEYARAEGLLGPAKGEQLDRLGEVVGVPKPRGETDDEYRARIRAAMKGRRPEVEGYPGAPGRQWVKLAPGEVAEHPRGPAVPPPGYRYETERVGKLEADARPAADQMSDAELRDAVDAQIADEIKQAGRVF